MMSFKLVLEAYKCPNVYHEETLMDCDKSVKFYISNLAAAPEQSTVFVLNQNEKSG